MARAQLFTPALIAASIIILVSFGARAAFGLFQIPLETEFGWPRTEFSLALALQNLAVGIGSPLFGAFAERMGDRRAVLAGLGLYVLGLILSTLTADPLMHQLLQFGIGMGLAGTGLGVLLAVVGRAAAEEHRSMALAIATAAGSAGQILFPPLTQWMLDRMGWAEVFLIFAAMLVALVLLMPMLRAPRMASHAELVESMGTVLIRSFRDPNYTLIFLGFFSCGFQVAFLTAHFPALVTEMCAPIAPDGLLARLGIGSTAVLGAVSLAVIGIFNIGGTLYAGWLGRKYRKKNLLALIYAGRTILTAAFFLMPITPASVLIFSAGMGALWLATIPLTSGLVAHLYGLRYMATLYGIVFLSHQLGGFLGVWLGGALYDRFGNYDLVWWIGVAVGAFSALVHLPVREARAQPLAA
ncbi:MAG: MFS transporter [Alphaproteobacteria bacterium]|nr:MAG: MFS transporter [Alphaproteobacteria bacterium]